MLRALILCLMIGSHDASADLRKQLTEKSLPNNREIKITGHPDYPPVIWQDDKTGKLTGIAVELVETILKEVNIKSIFLNSDTWGRAQEEVRAGRVDMLLPPYLTKERVEYYAYAKDPLLMDETVLFVQKGQKFKYRTFKDLEKLQGTAIISDSFGDLFDAYEKKHLMVHRLAKTTQCFEFLLSGRARYMVAGYYSGIAVAARMGIEDKVEILPKRVVVTGMYAPFSRKSVWNIPDLEKYITQRVRVFRKNGYLEKLRIKYLQVYKNG